VLRLNHLSVAAALAAALSSAPARGETQRNDSVEPADRITFMGGFAATEWFASTFEIPPELIPWTLCGIQVWIGPAGFGVFTVRLWEDPEGDEPFATHTGILWDSDADGWQFTGSAQQLSGIDLKDWFLDPFDAPRVRLGFRHSEATPAPPSIAADTDGFQPRMNHVNAVIPSVDRVVQRWYTVDDLPEESQPPGDWILRLDVAGPGQACPEEPFVWPDVGGQPDVGPPRDTGGPPPARDTGGPPPARDTGPPPGRDAGSGPPPATPVGDLTIDLVIPRAVTRGRNHELAVFGDGFVTGASVSLACGDCGSTGGPFTTDAFDVAVAGPRALHARVPAPDMPLGTYDVTVRLPGGAWAALPLAMEVLAEGPADVHPKVTRVVPDSAPAGTATPVVIEGSGFSPGAVVRLDDVACNDAEVLSGDRLTASVPSALGPGTYDLTVENPDGLASAPHPFTLTETEAVISPRPSTGCSLVPGRRRRLPITWPRLPWLLPLLLAGGCAGNGPSPASTFLDPDPGGRIWFVEASATEGGDGSQAAPFRQLPQALSAAAAGDALALGPGEYPEDLVLDRPLTVYGPAEGEAVLLGGEASEATVVVEAGAVGAVLARLGVRSQGDGVRVEAEASVTLSDVVIGPTGGAGITAEGADLHLEGGRVEDVAGAGLDVTGGVLSAERLAVARTGAHGVLVRGGSRARLVALHVESTAAAGIELRGAGGLVSGCRVVDVAESEETHTGSCLAVVETEEEVHLASNRLSGCALRGIRVYASRARVEDNDVAGAGLVGISVTTGSEAEVTDNRIRGSGGAAITAGTGISVDQSAATVTGNVVAGSGLYGLRADNAELVATGNRLSDCGARGVTLQGGRVHLSGNRVSDLTDFGIFFDAPAEESHVEGNEVVRATGAGIWISSVAVALSVADNRVRETRRPPGGDPFNGAGDGLALYRVAPGVDVTGNYLLDNEGAGLSLVEADARVAGNVCAGNGSFGVQVLDAPGLVTISDNRLESNAGAGINVFASDALLEGNTVQGSRLDEATGQGEGLFLLHGATVRLRGNTVRESARNGLLLLLAAEAELADNQITDSGRYGVECVGGYVDMGDGNVLADNQLGAMTGCLPPPG